MEKIKQGKLKIGKNEMRRNKNRKRVRVAVKSVRKNVRCIWRVRFKKEKNFKIGMKE